MAAIEPIEREFVGSDGMEALTGIPAATWRYHVGAGTGPPSLKIGRRRVWRLSTVREWIAEQEAKASNS